MRRGITQDQVNEAADALLKSGNRPTIERIRAQLGTGAPATVNRLLDVWWSGLGTRLELAERPMAIPEAPEPVQQLAGALWRLALSTAAAQADEQVAGERTVLASERTGLDARAQEMALERTNWISEREGLVARVRDLSANVEALQALVREQVDRLAESQAARGAAVQERQEAHAQADTLRGQLEAAQQTAEVARKRLEATHQRAEDRWLREVDRARQEALQASKKALTLEDALAKSRQAQVDQKNADARTIQDLTRRLGRAEAQIALLGERLKGFGSKRVARRAPPAQARGTRSAR